MSKKQLTAQSVEFISADGLATTETHQLPRKPPKYIWREMERVRRVFVTEDQVKDAWPKPKALRVYKFQFHDLTEPNEPLLVYSEYWTLSPRCAMGPSAE